MAGETFVASTLFAAIFLFGWRLHRTRTPRAVLSLGAGATASYVFVRMLPELNEAGSAFVAETRLLCDPRAALSRRSTATT